MQYFEGLKTRNILFLWCEHTRKLDNVKEGAGVSIHIQPSVEVIFVTDGKIDIEVNGITQTAHTGEAALIFPFQPHAYKKYGGSEFIRFDFDTHLASEFFNSHSASDRKSPIFKASQTSDFIVRNNFIGKNDASIFTAQSFLYSILADFISQIEVIPKKENDSVLVKAIDYMRENKEKDLSMTSVAKAIGYSASYFSYALNKTLGFGFNTLIAMIRVEHAKRLMRYTDKTLLEIVIECGFGSERSFYRQFKNMTGESPLKYRHSLPEA